MDIAEASRGFGAARKRGNDIALGDQINTLKKLIKNMDSVEFSAIGSKPVKQAKLIVKINQAIDQLDSAVADLKRMK